MYTAPFIALQLSTMLAALPPPQVATTPVTVEEYVQIARLGQVRVAPGGGAVAFVAHQPDLGADVYRGALYLWEVDRGERPLAEGFDDVRNPRWSPDAEWLAFVGAGPRSATTDSVVPRIWLLPRSGGPPIPTAQLPAAVIDFDWAPGGLIYALIGGGSGAAREVWRVRAAEGEGERVWRGDAGISQLAVSPDGAQIVYCTNGTGSHTNDLDYNLRLLDLESGRTRPLTSRRGSELAPLWSPDGATIVFLAPQDPAYPHSQTELFSVPATGGTPESLTASFDLAVIDARWPANSDLLFSAGVGAYTHLFAVRTSGAIERLSGGAKNIGAFDAAAAGSPIYAISESADEADELWSIEGSATRRLTGVNARARRWRLSRQELVRWTAPDGLSIEGLLIYPADYDTGRRYPLLVSPAGGPWRRVRNVLDQPGNYQLFAARGYAVLAANVRGGSGYGATFATARRTDLAGGDLVDLLAGADHVIGMGVADSARIAIFGGGDSEYAAHLTSWALTQTSRFHAAVVVSGTGYGPASVAEVATESHARLEAAYLAALQEERPLVDASRAVLTPLLIIEGASPPLVSHPRLLYGALRDRGRTVALVEVPGRAVGGTGPQTRTELFFRQLRWFDKYLKFGGADLFDFYLIGEAVPGPGGWQLRVTRAQPRGPYPAVEPGEGRYLEVVIEFEPDESAARAGTLESLELDLADLSLLTPDGASRSFAGTVTEIFGRETLILGNPGPITVSPPESGRAPSLTFHLAFGIPPGPGEYRLLHEGFGPVRIWVPREP